MTDINATVTPPLEITEAMLTDCSIAEPDVAGGEVAWDAGHEYSVGDLVARSTTHSVYRRKVAGTSAATPESDTANWDVVGPTNRWRCLILNQTAVTSATSSLFYEFTPGQRVTAIGLFGLVGDTLQVEAILDGDVVYDRSFALRYRSVRSMREYLTTPFRYRRAFWRLDLPMHTDLVVRFTITRVGGAIEVGAVVLGRWEDLGLYQAESETEEEDFSTITRDDFGVAEITRRKTIAITRFQTIVDEARGLRMNDQRRDLRATPAMWLPIADPEDPRAEALATLGLWRRWGQPYGTPPKMFVPFEVEEL